MIENIASSYLFIGSEENTLESAKSFIKKALCNSKACNLCIDCKKVDKKTHHSIIWLDSYSQYNTEDLEPIFKNIVFALDDGQHFFFVINNANLLNQFCANSLLKVMEEPPKGYHFILMAQIQDRVLPTILSRCIIQHYGFKGNEELSFVNYFKSTDKTNIAEFSKLLQSTKINESEIIYLIDQIYNFWASRLITSITNNNSEEIDKINNILDMLNEARSENIMPGSSKVFLRNLFMKFLVVLLL